MPDSTQDLILTELRSLREDFHSFARETAERVSSLETEMHSLIGNGQPGRIALLERAVSKLSQWRWWVIGAAAGGSGVISVIAWMATEASR
jgi:hypothetical protein